MKRLARWLRAAGYDAVVAPDGTPDSELLRRARRERRLLITRDRKLLEHRDAAGVVVLVEGNSTEDNAAALASRIPINWLHAPFSRCLVCNVALDQARITPAAEIPGKVRERGLPIWTCPRCQRLSAVSAGNSICRYPGDVNLSHINCVFLCADQFDCRYSVSRGGPPIEI